MRHCQSLSGNAISQPLETSGPMWNCSTFFQGWEDPISPMVQPLSPREGGSQIIPVTSLTKQSRVHFRVMLRWFGCLHPGSRLCSIHHYLTVESIQQGDTEMQQVNQEERYNKSANLLQTDLHQICKSYSFDKGLIWCTKISFKLQLKIENIVTIIYNFTFHLLRIKTLHTCNVLFAEKCLQTSAGNLFSWLMRTIICF